MVSDQNKSGLIAVGAYLRRLRTHRQMTPTVTAAQAGTDPSMLNRIEKGNVDTRGSLLLALTRIVGGNIHDIQQLMHDRYATASTGEHRANKWIEVFDTPPSPDERQHFSHLIASLTPPSQSAPDPIAAIWWQRWALLRATLRELEEQTDVSSAC